MSSGIVSIEDIIDNVKKNIKMVFQNIVRVENRQEVYIIGLQLTLDRLARELEFAQNNYQDISANQINWIG
jgi:CBS domain containing-hemolysin-like protein